MLEGLHRLVELQRTDDELTVREEEHAAIPGRRERIEGRRVACAERLEAAAAALKAAEADQRRAEGELQEREALLHKLEGQQFQVKSNVAYTALLQEMEGARQRISDAETQILEALEAIEAAREEQAAAELAARGERERLDADESALDAREQQLTAEIERLREQRLGVCAHLGAEILERYEKIAARKRPAVVLLERPMCLGCRLDVPSQRYMEVLEAATLVTCGHCQRILIHGERLAASLRS